MPKTTFTILVSVLILALVSGAVWFLFFYQGGERGADLSVTVKDFLPFGKLAEPNPNQGQNNAGGNTGANDKTSFGALRELAVGPVAGFTVIKGTTTLTARYLERHTGHIYDIGLSDQNPKRISNTTIPRVYEAIFMDAGKSVLIRYLADDNATIETYSATVPKTPEKNALSEQTGLPAVASELTGLFLPRDLSDISISPDGKKFFSLSYFGGGAVGATSVASGGNRTQIFTSPYSEWLSSWINEKTIVLTTKPSGGIPGYAYILNPSDKSFVKILGNIAGLTTLLNSDGKYLLYSSSGETGMLTAVYDTKNKTFRTLTISTMPEKCAWSQAGDKLYCGAPEQLSAGRYPDIWYKGQESFNDTLWSVDPSTGLAEVATDLRIPGGTQFDIIKPVLSTDGKYFFFINKKDLSLWSYELGR